MTNEPVNIVDPPNSPLQITKRNIKGWYFYSFSSEPFVVSAVATYIPLLLEHFARANGVELENHLLPCVSESDKCVLPIFNKFYVDTSSFALYTFSISVFFQTITVLTVSGIVDIWNSIRLKGLVLVFFSILGALSTIMISKLDESQILSLPLLYIIANSCFGVINVVGNSLLPIFVSDLDKFSSQNILSHNESDVEKLSSIISGRGASLGYSSALLTQIVSMFLVHKSKSKQDIQVAVLFVGIWWLFWQLPMLWLFNDVPHIDATSNTGTSRRRSYYSNRQIWNIKSLSYGWNSLWGAFKHARLLKDVMIFLLAWFIISDSVTTINSTAILFAKTELNMHTLNLISISIITMVDAMVGAFIIPQFLAKKFNLLPHQILIYIIIWTSFIPLYGILGFFFENIGLKHKFEMYLLAIWYGLSLGGLAAVSRSVFSLIIPRGKESTFFSMFSMTDKGSSIIGPFLIGFVTDKTHEIRYSFYLLFSLLILSLPILNMLDINRGKLEAGELGKITPSTENGYDSNINDNNTVDEHEQID